MFFVGGVLFVFSVGAFVGLWLLGSGVEGGRIVCRIMVVAPLITVVAAGCVRLFDWLTPGNWCEAVVGSGCDYEIGARIGAGIVLASLVFCVFWAAVQG